jgi:hypothetical protein
METTKYKSDKEKNLKQVFKWIDEWRALEYNQPWLTHGGGGGGGITSKNALTSNKLI